MMFTEKTMATEKEKICDALEKLENWIEKNDYKSFDPFDRKRGGVMMMSKAGVLGVPWIFVSNQTRGYLEDQEKNYGLGYCLKTPQQALERAFELLESDNLKKEWQKKRRKLLNEKIDVTKFMTWFIENYPESFEKVKENPEYYEGFK